MPLHGSALALIRVMYESYKALGVENIRHRRSATTTVVMRRLLSLDFVLKHSNMIWLPAEPEKLEFFQEIGLLLSCRPQTVRR